MKAPSILFAMLQEFGHLNPSFKLASALRARGYDVRYLAVEDVRSTIEARGFEVELLYPDLFPKGFMQADEKLGTFAKRRAITSRYQALLDRLCAQSPVRTPSSLWLVDVTQPQLAFWARKNHQPFLYLNTSLPQTKDPGVPPLRTGEAFGGSLLARGKSELSWRRFALKRRASAELASLGRMRPPYDLARAAAQLFGVPRRDVDTMTTYMPQLREVPELVCCPAAFDFPRRARAERVYIESIDLTRSEPEFAWGGLSNERPLVYCALGSQRYRSDEVQSFFRRLLAVFRERLDWQLLLSVGKHVAASALEPSNNVVIVERAPQLAVLKRAALMITHGGLGSVKECIMLGVPMLGVPLDVDQPGNVARLVHHGLGLAFDVQNPKEVELRAALQSLLERTEFRARLKQMQSRFQQAEAGERGVSFVERQLSAQRR